MFLFYLIPFNKLFFKESLTCLFFGIATFLLIKLYIKSNRLFDFISRTKLMKK